MVATYEDSAADLLVQATNIIQIIADREEITVNISTDYCQRGRGIGLAICRQIVEQHNGQIWAESSLGEGSSFFLYHPVSLYRGLEENETQTDFDC